MSPRSADPAVRTALVAAAARLLAAEGPRGLSTRRLAAEAGATTMAVYTHFGSMDEVRRAVRRDGFAQLNEAISALPRTDDPVADLTAAALAYFADGLAHPELYRAMFVDQPPESDADLGEPTFQHLLATVTRCIDAGRFTPTEATDAGNATDAGDVDDATDAGDATDATPSTALPAMWAAELWTAQHGMVTLALSRLLPVDQIRAVLIDMTCRLCIGFGDAPATARRSVELGSRVA